VRLASTHSPTEMTTLKDYLARMKPGQDKIYFMSGEDRQIIENSPHMEAFKAKGYEVLILTDAIDELWTQGVHQYKDMSFQSVGKGTVELGTEEEKKQAEQELEQKGKEYHSLLETMQSKLNEFVKEVRLSNRLTDSPACLVGNASDLSPQMEQMLKAMNQPVPQSKRILELNPNHPLTQKLQASFASNPSEPKLNDYAYLLYGQALLAEGSPLPDPARLSKLMADVLVKAL
jgi:molecular chaperone HtpG